MPSQAPRRRSRAPTRSPPNLPIYVRTPRTLSSQSSLLSSILIRILISVQFSSVSSVSHTSLAHNVPLPSSPQTQPSSHSRHRLGHRHHQSLSGLPPPFQPPHHPLTPSPLAHQGSPSHSHSRPSSDQPTQQPQNMPQRPILLPVGPFGAPTQLYQPPPAPIQCAATATAALRRSRNPSPSPSPSPSASSMENIPPSLPRPTFTLDHPRARPHVAYLTRTEATTAESPDVSSRSPSDLPRAMRTSIETF